MEPLNDEADDCSRLEAIFNKGVFLINDGLLIAAEISLAADFLPVRDFLVGYEYAPLLVANLTAERILAPLTELFPAGLFIVRNGRDIRTPLQTPFNSSTLRAAWSTVNLVAREY
jgi:hypothetical protein